MMSFLPATPGPWLPLLFLLAAFLMNILTQIAGCRITRGRHFLGTVAVGFSAGGLILIILSASSALLVPTKPSSLEILPANLLIYGCLGYGYANFVNLGQSSIRIRLFEEIRRHGAGLPLQQIRKSYDETALLAARLHRLTESGDLQVEGGTYRVGRLRFVLIASAIFTLKRIVLGRKSEFDDASA